MNDVIRETASMAQYAWVVGLMTVFFMTFFVGVVVWLLSKRARAGLDEAASLPFESEEEE